MDETLGDVRTLERNALMFPDNMSAVVFICKSQTILQNDNGDDYLYSYR